jgi:1-acyl-sn-glycerol-3-phosphate acyltransferase
VTPGTNVLRPLLDALEEGASLILFPEGTRGSGETVAPFKSGIYHLCRMMPEIELVPTYLDNLNRMLPKGEFVAVPLLGRAVFGPPIRLNAGEKKTDFLERAHKAVCDLRNI